MVNIANVHDIEMKYCKFGRGNKNLVIIPGLSFKPVTDNAEAVAAAYEMFADDYTVWLFDVRTNATVNYSIANMAEDTVTVMKAMGIESADIFGASMGGMISQCIAIVNPEMVHKLILGSTMCRNNETSIASVKRWNSLAKNGATDELIAQCIDDMYSEATLEQYRDFLIEANSDLTDEQVAEFRQRTEAILEFDISDDLSSIQCPVLVIGAENDKVLGGQASPELAEVIGCELYMYTDEYGHCVYDEAPDYKERMIEFLN